MTSDTDNIGKKIFTGAIWTVGSRMSIRFLGIISMIILARLLDPEDFGLVAKAVMIQSFLLMFTEMGLEAALIKDQKATKEDYDTVWTLHVVRGVLLSLILAAIARPASTYFHDDRLENIIYCYAAVVFLGGFYNIGVVDFRKKFNFSYDFKYGLYRKIMAFMTTITVAFIWQTYWALVAGVVAGQLTALISSYLMSPYRPTLSLVKWNALFHFSKWMTLHELLSSAGGKIDAFILSRFSSSATLGLYTVATELAVTPVAELTMPVARAMMPGLSKINGDIEQVRMMNQSILGLLLIFILPTAVGIHLLSTNFTLVILGDKWLEAAPFVSILSLSSIASVITATTAAMFIAIDKVSILSKLAIVRFSNRLLCLSIGFWLNGVIGMVMGLALSLFIYSLVIIYVQRRLQVLQIKLLLQNTWRSITATLAMYIGLRLVIEETHITASMSPFPELGFLVVIGVVIYCLTLLLLWMLSGKEEGPEKMIARYFRRNRA